MKIKKITVLFCSLFFIQCLYKDYNFKENLVNEFYLMESDILPSRYISLEYKDSKLVIIYDVIEIIGNKNVILVKTKNNKNEERYELIEVCKVEYPEDVKIISYQEFHKQKKTIVYEYSYDTNNGFIRKN